MFSIDLKAFAVWTEGQTQKVELRKERSASMGRKQARQLHLWSLNEHPLFSLRGWIWKELEPTKEWTVEAGQQES